MRKINRAPEIRTGEDLHTVYSREERRAMSPSVVRKSSSGRFFPRYRILLFDLLFLLVIGGVIVPFLINRNLSGKIGGFGITMELRRQDERDVFISLHIVNPSSGERSEEPFEVELVLPGETPLLFTELPPGPGERRTVRVHLEEAPEAIAVYCRIRWGEESIRLNGKV